MKAIFLYAELADYTMACFKRHLELHPEDELHVVHYPVNPEAPFNFDSVERLYLYSKEHTEITDIWEIYHKTRPSVIVCSGWNDALYNKFVKAACKLTPVYLCFDNVFRYTVKQIVGLPVARFMFRGVYAGAWVPGRKQVEFARLLGFPDANIHTGFYSTNTHFYENLYHKFALEKEQHFPKRFLCVARYIPQKGLEYLWQAFAELHEEGFNEWELWCAGTGEDYERRMEHQAIKHLGFVQPKDFELLIQNCGVFVLPSLFEPWGVVVNEFAAAGFPMVLSKKVGSSNEFLEEGTNGFWFQPGKKEDIKKMLRKAMLLTDGELRKMGRASFQIANKYNAEAWSDTLSKLAGENGI